MRVANSVVQEGGIDSHESEMRDEGEIEALGDGQGWRCYGGARPHLRLCFPQITFRRCFG